MLSVSPQTRNISSNEWGRLFSNSYVGLCSATPFCEACTGCDRTYQKRFGFEQRRTCYESAITNEPVSIVSATPEVVYLEVLEAAPSRAFACSLPSGRTRKRTCGDKHIRSENPSIRLCVL